MQPVNTQRRPIDLGDGAPVRCVFAARADAPVFWEECQTDATIELEVDLIDEFNKWLTRHPNAIVMLRPGRIHLCDTHHEHIVEILDYDL